MPESKTCLLISYGPVPTDRNRTIEGGGMRVWGLATGLQRNGIDVTVAVHESYPQHRAEHRGVRLRNWSITTLPAIANGYNTVIMSYCMGEPSEVVAKTLSPAVQLILDVYVPIYVEVSARNSANLEFEYVDYLRDLDRFSLALRRGDYFLCANETQETFYTGVLSALGRINPLTYSSKLIEIVPFGIESEPPMRTEGPQFFGIKPEDFVVLWFGGLYPWFDIRDLIRAIQRLSESGKSIMLLVVGGKNPFNPNPVFRRQYDETFAYAETEGLIGRSVFFIDWVDYSTRANWYALANLVVSINTPGQEGRYSWRTRVMDYVWGELPIATNGGDPLSDLLIAKNAAYRLKAIDEASLVEDLEYLYEHPQLLKQLQGHLIPLKPTFYWESITQHLANVIVEGIRASDLDISDELTAAIKRRRRQDGLARYRTLPVFRQLLRVGKARGYLKRYGLGSTVRQVRFVARHFLLRRSTDRQYVFLSQPLERSDGTVALVKMLEEVSARVGGKHLRVVTPHVDSSHVGTLRNLGVTHDKMDPRLGLGALDLRLSLKANDFVLLGGSAMVNYRDAVFSHLYDGRLHHAYWYVDDEDEVQSDDQRLTETGRQLVREGKLTIVVPSSELQQSYEKLFAGPDGSVTLLGIDKAIDERRPSSRLPQ